MALTEEQKTDLYKLGVGIYDAAIGTIYGVFLGGLLESGRSVDQLYESLSREQSFVAQSPGFAAAATSTQFSTAFVDHATGDTLSAQNRDWAIDFLAGLLDGGMSRGAVMHLAIDALDAVPHDNANFGNAAAQFDNKVEVARYYTEGLGGSALILEELRSTIASVDETRASVEAAKAALLASAANAPLIETDISLVGIQQSGVELV